MIDFEKLYDHLNKESKKELFKKTLFNLNFDKDIFKLRYKLFHFLSKKTLNFTLNLNRDQLIVLNKFTKMKPFKILQCDKNIGTILISHSNFIKLSNDYIFTSNSSYVKLSDNPLFNTVNHINISLKTLVDNNHICRKIYNKLFIKDTNNVKLGSLRVLPKIHKNKFGIRPIINCIDHPTSKICFFIDILLQPFITKIKTILKDSQNLIQICNQQLSGPNIYLYSCDFESLYTNIKPEHASTLLTDFISEYLVNSNYLSPFGFKTLLNIIFSNNYFTFENEYYQQNIGIPMGCKCGPSIANLFLYIIEKSWLTMNNPLIYCRFIDDIFYVSSEPLDKTAFCNHFDYLKLNISEGKIVNFLDLYIYYDNITEKLMFNLYTKPTNTFSYLLPNSNHPNHIFKNIPKSLFIRLRRICSTYTDYLYNSRILILQLYKRNYSLKKCIQICRGISNIERDLLIPYRNKENIITNKNTCFFTSTYDNAISFLNQFISSNNKEDSYIIKPISRINNNIASLLIHNKKFSFFKKMSTTPCNEDDCKICKFVNRNYFIKILHLPLPLLCEASCLSTGIVYIIYCSKCNFYYIGESSKSARVRITQHIYTINNFSKYLDKSLGNFDQRSPVAAHFAESGHILENHFSFFIFQKDIIDNDIRKSKEADLINLFVNLEQSLLNKHIPALSNIKSLCFQI